MAAVARSDNHLKESGCTMRYDSASKKHKIIRHARETDRSTQVHASRHSLQEEDRTCYIHHQKQLVEMQKGQSKESRVFISEVIKHPIGCCRDIHWTLDQASSYREHDQLKSASTAGAIARLSVIGASEG